MEMGTVETGHRRNCATLKCVVSLLLALSIRSTSFRAILEKQARQEYFWIWFVSFDEGPHYSCWHKKNC